MPDPEVTTSTKTTGVVGIDKPFSKAEAKKMDGVDEETRLFEGVHPDDKSRVSVTFAGLKAEFGDKEGERKYTEIAGIRGGSVFFNPATEATSFRPPLGIGNLNKKDSELVDEILASKE